MTKKHDVPSHESNQYRKTKIQLDKILSVYCGVDTAVKYLEKYSKEEDKELSTRKENATLNNFVFRIVNSLKNIIFRREIDTTALKGTSVYPYIETIDLKSSLNEFSKEVLRSLERDGKTYIMVDSPIRGEQIKTRADEVANGIRPYFIHIDRKNILRYDSDIVIIKEKYKVANGMQFVNEYNYQFRVIRSNGSIEIWRDGELFTSFAVPYQGIPVIEIGRNVIPPLYDLTKININHMNRTSELNRYIRTAGAPIPLTWGLGSNDGAVSVIGVNQGISFSGNKNESDFQWREMDGKNSEIIREQIKSDEKDMLDISVNLVTSNQTRTATEVNSDNIENESKLSESASSLEYGINKALKLFALMQSSSLLDEQIAKVNRDFDSTKLTDEEVTQYRADYINGIISLDRLMSVLENGKRYSKLSKEDWDIEKAKLSDSIG